MIAFNIIMSIVLTETHPPHSPPTPTAPVSHALFMVNIAATILNAKQISNVCHFIIIWQY